MRVTAIIALLALFCMLSVAFATEGLAAAAPTPKAVPAVDNSQIISLQGKITKLDSELAELRKSLEQIQKDNQSLTIKLKEAVSTATAAAKAAATPVVPKEDGRLSQLDETVKALRSKVESLTKQFNESSFGAQAQHAIKVATVFVTEVVFPKLEQACKVVQIYVNKAATQIKPTLAQVQPWITRVYHQARAYHQQGKDIFVAKVSPLMKQLTFVPPQYRPMTVQALWTVALFLPLFIIFIILYSIWKAMCSCCCRSSNKNKKQQPQQQKQKK